MIDFNKRESKEAQKEKVRKRMRKTVDPDNYEYIPEKKHADYYDNDVPQRVAIYVRVSTDDIRQTTSYELQKKYYEDFVRRHPNWTLVDIYADEGISGTSLKHRDAFNRMIKDCKDGKIDLIITKSVSRFARNVMITIGTVRDLAHLKPPVGVFFESECIFSLNDDSQMALSFQATMAEEESHTRSRSMETSLRMRLDNGIPLTPKLLGYTHDAEGNLVINPEEAKTVKLTFFMYLYGYSTKQIAEILIALERKSYLGNIKWTSGAVLQILRNERHCGDVLTRKTFTEDYRTHRQLKNRGDRPQSRYFNHHEAIVSRDDFIAVQRLLDNARYRNKSFLPELRVIETGVLKGFVTINPRWGGFAEDEFFLASRSAYDSPDEIRDAEESVDIEVVAGDLDLRGFEIARTELFESRNKPTVSFTGTHVTFSNTIVGRYGSFNTVELLIHPDLRKIAIRSTDKDNRNGILISKSHDLVYRPRNISTAAYGDTLFSIMGWNEQCRYKIVGTSYGDGKDTVYVFNADDAEAYFKSSLLNRSDVNDIQPFASDRERIRAIPEGWLSSFGQPFYIHEQSLRSLALQSEKEWKLRIEGRLIETGKKINVTPYEELRKYIMEQLSPLELTEEYNA